MIGKRRFGELFKVGQTIQSGGDAKRKRAAKLKILAIEDDGIQYQSLTSKDPNKNKRWIEYRTLQELLDRFSKIDPKSIEKSVNRVLEKAGLPLDHLSGTYSYGFAKEYLRRINRGMFLSQGELEAPDSAQLSSRDYVEGGRFYVVVERIERDPEARKRCIQHFGAWCRVCKFDFEKSYGAVGKGYIHVHHRRRLASSKGKRKVDPIKDLIPLCPNCHAMVHAQIEPLTVAELHKLMEQAAMGAATNGKRQKQIPAG